MTCLSDCVDEDDQEDVSNIAANNIVSSEEPVTKTDIMMACPSCGFTLNNNSQEKVQQQQQQGGIQYLPGLPAGVKFDPSDQELIQHLEAKVRLDENKLHPLIDEFILTIGGDNGICYTHPEKLPGVSKDGLVRHFFHRPSKAYTTGTRKRRKVHTETDGCETRWHKTGKTRPIVVKGRVKGFKKILVLYTNYGRQKKPEKTNWVMHQYHLGNNEDEKDGEIVVSKVFYQTQPRQCTSSSIKDSPTKLESSHVTTNPTYLEFYNSSTTLISFDQCDTNHSGSSLMPSINAHERSFNP